MSLILEALRKSEAERRLGRTPDLMTPMPGTYPRSANGRGWKLVVVALLVLIVAGGLAAAWWLGRQTAAVAPPVLSQPVVEPSAPVDAVAESPPAAAPSAQPTPDPAAVTPQPAVRTTPPPAVHYPTDPDFASNERESLPVLPPGIALPDQAAVTPAPAAPAPVASAPASAPPMAVEPAPAVPQEPWVPHFKHLSEAERAGFPPLKMSMHVFNEDPTRRFAMIDGQRHVEGARLADGVVLQHIRRDGAVIDLRGRQVLIERP